jgi:ADP-heptose:LPS heptosyltransferase
LFFGGPEEKGDHEHVRTVLGADRLFFPATPNFPQAAHLIQKCDVFLSVDTVMMHLAAAMKVRRQVVIETPTWNPPIQPYGNPFTLIKNPVVNGRALDFYRYDGGNIKGTRAELIACMASVTVENVFAAVAG